MTDQKTTDQKTTDQKPTTRPTYITLATFKAAAQKGVDGLLALLYAIVLRPNMAVEVHTSTVDVFTEDTPYRLTSKSKVTTGLKTTAKPERYTIEGTEARSHSRSALGAFLSNNGKLVLDICPDSMTEKRRFFRALKIACAKRNIESAADFKLLTQELEAAVQCALGYTPLDAQCSISASIEVF